MGQTVSRSERLFSRFSRHRETINHGERANLSHGHNNISILNCASNLMFTRCLPAGVVLNNSRLRLN